MGTAKARPPYSTFRDIGIQILRRWSRHRNVRKPNASHSIHVRPTTDCELDHGIRLFLARFASQLRQSGYQTRVQRIGRSGSLSHNARRTDEDRPLSENTATAPHGIAQAAAIPVAAQPAANSTTTFAILISLSVCHMLNDMNQSLVPAIYPVLKDNYQLDFGQIGLITLAFQMTASMLQPVVGMVTDRHPQPFSLPIAMCCSLVGLLMLAVATTYPMILFSAALVGIGSSVFHPESSRVARMASGGRYGFAQSLFQVGGNTGGAIGPLLAAAIVLPRGQWADRKSVV